MKSVLKEKRPGEKRFEILLKKNHVPWVMPKFSRANLRTRTWLELQLDRYDEMKPQLRT